MQTKNVKIEKTLTLDQVQWNHARGYITPVNDGATMEMLWEPKCKRFLKDSDQEVAG